MLVDMLIFYNKVLDFNLVLVYIDAKSQDHTFCQQNFKEYPSKIFKNPALSMFI